MSKKDRNLSNHKNKKKTLLISCMVLGLVCAAIFALNKSNIPETNSKTCQYELDNGLTITQVGTYTGPYLEDASDEEVANIMSIMVTNNNEEALQYAEIILYTESEEYLFKMSTLNPNETVVVLEADRKKFDQKNEYTGADSQYVVFFDEQLNTYEDSLKIQSLDGAFNITNISDKDINGDIVVYFKDYKEKLLYGGITYRGRIEGGLKSGELRQVMASKFSEKSTKVMFITIAEE